ncbi:MAG: lytic transglycosylase domain-containing protein [Micrococcales bacterium]|nr:lytic transglycosylase domain-containing protein [Actinomycetota bacterium]NCA07513.1 lytic transglycosylase domain-containing protein [Micrococcales bacterium]
MGRYELVRPSLRQRFFTRLFGNSLSPWLAEKPLSKRVRSLILNLLAFGFASSYVLVTVVDPYGGALASAYAFDSFYSDEDAQSYGYSSQQKISFARGGWEVVTGDEAAAIYVANAAPPESGTIKEFAFTLVMSNNWGRDQYSCLVALWDRESNWRFNAYNSGSGAYGIPQALPGAKMAEMGADWQTNPETQIRWGVNYIKHRYGAPCGAMAHSNKFRWY